MERILEILEQRCLPSLKLIRELCHHASNVLLQQPNVLRIDPGVKVVGSLYGQYFDLRKLINEQPPVNYLFLGNYIGYGDYSLQTILLLLCLKVRNPNKVSLLRGNQQTYQSSIEKGLFKEICSKYGNDQPWKQIIAVFQYLPLAAVIGDTYLAVSGGISDYERLGEICEISRHRENIETSGLLWDTRFQNEAASKKLSYGREMSLQQIQRFLKKNRLKMMIRSNGVFQQGYQRDSNEICLSICSCPYFLSKYNNKGSIVIIGQDLEYSLQEFKRTLEPSEQFTRIED